MRDPDLWKRLKSHRFDGPGSLPFSKKLEEAAGWKEDFTKRAIEEYRRFVYLTQVSDKQVTPSADIDQIWHMHMTYTRNYWDLMCDTVLGRKLHHEPCIGPEEALRYEAQYLDTRKLYAREFGEVPPEDIWPSEVTEHLNGRINALIAGGALLFFAGLVFWLLAGPSGAFGVIAGAAFIGYSIVLEVRRKRGKYKRRGKTGVEVTMYADGGGRKRGYDKDSDAGGDGDGDGGGCGD